ncbi:MAG: thiamine phosphate synthase [Deltaproteobacteria bacterium]|nr:thiamine phosphate synthase [Deltaproteobacteria bacterium]
MSVNVHGLYAIIDADRLAPALMPATALELSGAGATIIQLRAKSLGSGEFLKAARDLRAALKDAAFIVNDRVDIAMMSRADGVHLGQNDIPLIEAKRLLGNGKIIGVSTHNLKEALQAASEGADYIAFGPVFKTRSKRDAQEMKGIACLKEVCDAVQLPVVAIGGITGENARQVIVAGARAVAMISELIDADDMKAKAASIVGMFGNQRS